MQCKPINIMYSVLYVLSLVAVSSTFLYDLALETESDVTSSFGHKDTDGFSSLI